MLPQHIVASISRLHKMWYANKSQEAADNYLPALLEEDYRWVVPDASDLFGGSGRLLLSRSPFTAFRGGGFALPPSQRSPASGLIDSTRLVNRTLLRRLLRGFLFCCRLFLRSSLLLCRRLGFARRKLPLQQALTLRVTNQMRGEWPILL